MRRSICGSSPATSGEGPIRRPAAKDPRGAGDRRRRLLAFLEGLDVAAAAGLTDDTPLISSGLFDSLALFHLVEWIERETGAPVDPGSFDFLREWDTVPGILAFVERRRAVRSGEHDTG
ncbi:MAG: phosphopantetheine-binding protein [Thermoanaerobaculia bacterium]